MEHLEMLKREIKVLLFDQYGTNRRYAERADGSSNAISANEELDGQAEQLRYMVAAHALRELDD